MINLQFQILRKNVDKNKNMGKQNSKALSFSNKSFTGTWI